MFNEESNCFQKTQKVNNDYFDIPEFVKRNVNNKMFAKLLFEYLFYYWKKHNFKVVRQYRSFPKDTLVYVRDHSIQPHKKIKQKYTRAP